MNELLCRHFARYPNMTVQDAVKLLYQRAFGAEHVVRDAQASLAWLAQERAGVPFDPEAALLEPLGNGLCRVHLAALPPALKNETINRLFVLGAQAHRGDKSGFEQALCTLRALAQAGKAPFSLSEADEYLKTYRAAGCPSVRHSTQYRAQYAPAYRVMPESMARFLPLFCAVDEQARTNGAVRLAIDGNAAAGKTTLAKLLQAVYDCPVIHMDDFFLPLEKRTPDRLAEPGGNVDYERFLHEVVPALVAGRPVSYRAFDCSVMALGRAVALPYAPITVVEVV